MNDIPAPDIFGDPSSWIFKVDWFATMKMAYRFN